MISYIGRGMNTMAAKTIGQVWQPKAQRMSVGRDLCPISATSFGGEKRNTVVADGNDTRFMANEVYGYAKAAAQRGFQAKNFRTVDTGGFSFSSSPKLPSPAADPADEAAAAEYKNLSLVTGTTALHETKNRLVTFDGTNLQIWEKDQNGEVTGKLAEHTVTSDVRISWDGNDSPIIRSGRDALTGDTLKAVGGGEILIRKSASNVEAGENTTVLNLSGETANFGGGGNVTYLGSYTGSTITGGNGKTTYAGYFNGAQIDGSAGAGIYSGVFENATIHSGDASDSFSGYFSAATINGGGGQNDFRGLFLHGSTVNGGDDGNGFQGRFIDSSVNGGKGDDVFGSTVNLNGATRVVRKDGKEYSGLESDFIDSQIDAGEGDDTLKGVVWGGGISMGDGDDAVEGVFSETVVSAGKGNDIMAALFSQMSSFDAGSGNDTVTLGTASASSVRTGEGSNTVTMGYNVGANAKKPLERHNGTYALTGSTWQRVEQYLNKIGGMRDGELAGNSVDASVGENTVLVNTGQGVQSVSAGTRQPEAGGANSPEAEETQSASNTERTGEARQIPAEESDRKKMSMALNRYAKQSGIGPEVSGGTGVTIATGAGEDIAIRTLDSLGGKEDSGDWIQRRTRRDTGFGSYEWQLSQA